MQLVKSRARFEREQAGKSREQVAFEAGCSVSSVVNIEAGRRCSDTLASRIAAVLSIEAAELFEQVIFEARR